MLKTKKQFTKKVNHKPEVKGEAMPIHFTNGLPEIVLDYLGTDIKPISELKTNAKSNQKKYSEFKLFGRKLADLMQKEALKVSNLILQGEEKEVEEALAIVRENPLLLRCEVEAKDPIGRRVRGTALQIAAMAGDADLKTNITEENKKGMVERLIKAGDLSKEEIIEQLKCVTSFEAELANEVRNRRVLAAIKKFGNDLSEIKTGSNESFEEFQLRCKYNIDQLEAGLKSANENVITAGYIFDIAILQKSIKWYKENLEKLNGYWSYQSDIFWVKAFGKLQTNLSFSDAVIIERGVGHWNSNQTIPARSLNNTTRLEIGLSTYIGYFEPKKAGDGGFPGARAAWFDRIISNKKNSIAKLCAVQCMESKCGITPFI